MGREEVNRCVNYACAHSTLCERKCSTVKRCPHPDVLIRTRVLFFHTFVLFPTKKSWLHANIAVILRNFGPVQWVIFRIIVREYFFHNRMRIRPFFPTQSFGKKLVFCQCFFLPFVWIFCVEKVNGNIDQNESSTGCNKHNFLVNIPFSNNERDTVQTTQSEKVFFPYLLKLRDAVF